jgi:transketolase
MRDAFISRLTEMAASDPRIMLITGDLGFGVLTEYSKRFPKQFINAGVAEQNMTGLATGLALEGYTVFTYSIANFVFMRCLEQIRNDAAYHGCNVNVVAVGAGFSYGALGISHHATEDMAIMRALPDLTVVSPGDDWEAAEATQAIASQPGVCYLRLDRQGLSCGESSEAPFQLGRARTVRSGNDLTLVATGGMLAVAMQAADQLAADDIQCRVISMHTVKPLDRECLIQASQETGGIVTIEEHSIDGGLGGAAAECLLESGSPPAFFKRIGLSGGFSSIVGSQEYLRTQYGLTADNIATTVHGLLGRRLAPIRMAA